MAETGIEWADVVWNPTVGCTRTSPGCKNCYAFTLHDRRHAAHKAGKDVPKQYAKPFTELQLMPDRLDAPLHWRKPKKVFVNSVSDLFHEDVPDEFINSVFRTMIAAKQHIFQVLTKRAERMADYCSNRWGHFHGKEFPLASNIWLGVSVENQACADERIPHLLATPAAVRFLSCEPLLAEVDLVKWLGGLPAAAGISWVICGGESGPHARSCQVEWIRSLVSQCKAASVPVFVKQDSGRLPGRQGRIPDDIWEVKEFPR